MKLTRIAAAPAAFMTAVVAILAASLASPASVYAQPSAPAAPADAYVIKPAKPQPSLRVADVRIGMKGYGMTVFHGVTIEPFACEVVSIQYDSPPGRAIVWIRCPDDRMQQTGPVAGMSGSPIYLWAPDEPQVLGKGGKLIGAFAFGFTASKDCYVGVQPIEYMREAGDRANEQKPGEGLAGNSNSNGPTALHTLMSLPQTRMLPASATWRARALLAASDPSAYNHPDSLDSLESREANLSPAAPLGLDGHFSHMALPIALGSPEAAAALAPLMEPYGLTTMATNLGAAASRPPAGIDAKSIRFEPGSVLAVPLAWGDCDLNAAGTVTDVLPDGRILGFGHAMFGQGALAIPVSTGFIHMIMPGIVTSFKLAGSANLAGTMVRDENCAVILKTVNEYESAPVHLSLQAPGQPKRDYYFNVALYKPLVPMIAASAIMQGITAAQNLPAECTARFKGSMTFEGHHEINFDAMVPGAGANNVVMLMIPALSAMSQNPIHPMKLEKFDLAVDVEQSIKTMAIVKSRLDRDTYAPGEDVGVTLHLQPYNKPAFDKHVVFTLPKHLPTGDYAFQLCDAATYNQNILAAKPYLTNVASGDDIARLVQTVMGVSNQTLYAVMQLPDEGLAVGPQEMSRIPSSRRAMIASPNNPGSTPYVELFEQKIPMDTVIEGSATFRIHVDKNLYPPR